MINLKKILCPIDYSESSRVALNYAVSFAMKDEAKLYLLHVIDMRTFEDDLAVIRTTQIKDEITKQHKSRLLDYIPKEIRSDIKIEALVIQGIPFVEIIDASKKKDRYDSNGFTWKDWYRTHNAWKRGRKGNKKSTLPCLNS